VTSVITAVAGLVSAITGLVAAITALFALRRKPGTAQSSDSSTTGAPTPARLWKPGDPEPR
jgi:hypothetical protein